MSLGYYLICDTHDVRMNAVIVVSRLRGWDPSDEPEQGAITRFIERHHPPTCRVKVLTEHSCEDLAVEEP